MSDMAIEFDDVVAGYGEFMILNNLSFKAKHGKITLLLGPNGAGKSTVLKTLFGLLKVRQGRIRLDGQDITGATAKELLTQHGIAFVPQGRNLFGQLSVIENLELGGITLGMKTTHERIPEILELFPRVKERLHSAASSLSGGEQKQLEVGRALLLRPKVLLIDEPSIGLSPAGGAGRVPPAAQAGRQRHHDPDGRAEREERAEDGRRGDRARIGPAGAAPARRRTAGRPEHRAPVPRRCARGGQRHRLLGLPVGRRCCDTPPPRHLSCAHARADPAPRHARRTGAAPRAFSSPAGGASCTSARCCCVHGAVAVDLPRENRRRLARHIVQRHGAGAGLVHRAVDADQPGR